MFFFGALFLAEVDLFRGEVVVFLAFAVFNLGLGVVGIVKVGVSAAFCVNFGSGAISSTFKSSAGVGSSTTSGSTVFGII